MGFVRNGPLDVQQGTIGACRYSVEPSAQRPEIEVDSADRFERRGVDQFHNARSAGSENHISRILSYESRAGEQRGYGRYSKHRTPSSEETRSGTKMLTTEYTTALLCTTRRRAAPHGHSF